MLNKIRFLCALATFLLAGLTALLVVVLGLALLAAEPYERLDSLMTSGAWIGAAWILAWSAWLAGQSLDRMAGTPGAMRGLANRLADATEKVADRTRKAASREK